ncbi:LexA family transcriptional regulator [Novosphingobium sp. NDB2Meth1]|uniref:LexA family protein n=1 Tax=Novosphingobium sp. NDB2Meth1 TaxID=1892847 RepID=UPI000931C4C3|nr:hypothetical protein [Novosphingobium sp. NDB2Meth1]
MMGLTEQQAALLRFIAGYQAAHGGVSPTMQECARGIGCRSKSAIVALLDRMEERGAISRLRYRDRAIKLLTPVTVPSINGTPLYAAPMVGQRAMLFSGERV